ncbi:MAG TPA: hypothetical protein DCM05_02780 [Elusimicrobia bacterium]|nr:hypothetical protein [Elusimicrobiota bacterium]
MRLTALLALLLLPGPLFASPKNGLKELIAYVVDHGRDNLIDADNAQLMGFAHAVETPVREVALEGQGSPDGRQRSFTVAYNSDGKTVRPAAVVLWRMDSTGKVERGTRVIGRTFLMSLDGKLARVLRVERLSLGADGLVNNLSPVDIYETAVRADYRRELELWLSWHQARKKKI